LRAHFCPNTSIIPSARSTREESLRAHAKAIDERVDEMEGV
jgi:hypothetical protein